MAGTVRLFEKDTSGQLHEVEPEAAAILRQNRRFSHVNLSIDVLWTAEEEAARDAEEAEAVSRAKALAESQAKAAEEQTERRRAAEAKLEKLGLTPEDLRDFLG